MSRAAFASPKLQFGNKRIFQLRPSGDLGESGSMKQTRREFVRTLFVASQAAVASRFLPVHLFGQSAAPDALNFPGLWRLGTAGRTRPDGSGHANGHRRANASDRNSSFPSATIFTRTAWPRRATRIGRLRLKTFITAPSLQVPWYVILGNHDYHGNCDAQIAYSQLSQRWNMPARYFIQSRRLTPPPPRTFFYLDTTPMVKSYWHEPADIATHVSTQDVPKQLAWFKAALAASTAHWKIVIGHHPIYSGGGRTATRANSSRTFCRCFKNTMCRPTSTATTTTCNI